MNSNYDKYVKYKTKYMALKIEQEGGVLFNKKKLAHQRL